MHCIALHYTINNFTKYKIPFEFIKLSFRASLNWNPHSIYIRSMNLQTHSPDTFAGGIIPSTTQNQKNTFKYIKNTLHPLPDTFRTKYDPPDTFRKNYEAPDTFADTFGKQS